MNKKKESKVHCDICQAAVDVEAICLTSEGKACRRCQIKKNVRRAMHRMLQMLLPTPCPRTDGYPQPPEQSDDTGAACRPDNTIPSIQTGATP